MGKRNKRWKGKLRQFVASRDASNKKEGASKTVAANTGAKTTIQRYIPPCHVGPVEVFKLGNSTVYAGSRQEFATCRHIRFGLYISCAGADMAPKPMVQMHPSLQGQLPSMPPVTPWIAFAWEDGCAPSFTRPMWEELIDLIKKVEGNIAVYCVGGHGRTGTALSILAALGGVVPLEYDPVKWIRDRYCDEVVETNAQVDYIKRITGREVQELASWSWRFGDVDDFDDVERFAKATTHVVTQGGKPFTPATTVMGPKKAVGKPVTNAAGDVTHYDYEDEEEDGD